MTYAMDQNQPRPASQPAPTNGSGGVLALPEDALVILPVRNLVLYPGMILPLTIGREGSIAAAQQAVKSERPVGLVLQKDSTNDNPGPEDLYQIGTVAQVLRYITTQDGGHHLIAQGQERFRVKEFLPGYPFLVARVERIADGTRGKPGRGGALPAAQEAGRRSARAAAADAAGAGVRRGELHLSRGACRHGRRLHGHQARREAGAAGNVERADAARQAAGAARRIASKCSSSRARSTSGPRRRWTSASASSSCASS